MLTPDFFPGAGLRLDDFVLTPDAAVALLVATTAFAPCPRCGAPSDRVHSRYRRTVADLPCHGRPVALRLVVRRFRCTRPACPQVIFCERLPALLDADARTTARLANAHRSMGFALGGEAGSRLAERLDVPTSPDTLLRRVKGCPDEPAPPPRYVGIDDWAFRKGRRYGTVVVDLERGRVIDLLPDREPATVEKWLREHSGIEVITRPRRRLRPGASAGAPAALQVADRWHLLKNLREALERLFGRLGATIADALWPPALRRCGPGGGGPGPHWAESGAAPTGPARSTRRPPGRRPGPAAPPAALPPGWPRRPWPPHRRPRPATPAGSARTGPPYQRPPARPPRQTGRNHRGEAGRGPWPEGHAPR